MYRTSGTFDPPALTGEWPAVAAARDPEVLKIGASWVTRLAAPAISLLVLAVALTQLARFDLSSIRAVIPTSPSFWILFAVSYVVPPLADWIIFRRLWRLPAAGFLALVRKLIGNELLLGYVGELYFYSWARKRSAMVGAPFGAVKDVAILSAVVGNCVTLAMLAVAYPLLGSLNLGIESGPFALSVAVVLLTSLAAMLFRRRLFSLPWRELRFVVAVHVARIAATTLLAAYMWHVALPEVAASMWLLLATLRLLLSRLPFIPNKDVVFAGLAVLVVGQNAPVVDLMALMAGLILGTHLILGTLLTGAELVGWKRLA